MKLVHIITQLFIIDHTQSTVLNYIELFFFACKIYWEANVFLNGKLILLYKNTSLWAFI